MEFFMGKYSTKTERRLGRRPSNRPRNQRGPEHPKNPGKRAAEVKVSLAKGEQPEQDIAIAQPSPPQTPPEATHKAKEVRRQKAGRKTNTKSGPGKGTEKKTPSGAQPANPGWCPSTVVKLT